MKGNTKIGLLIAGAIAILLFLGHYLFNDTTSTDEKGAKKEPKFKTDQWEPDFSLSNKGPNGLYFMEQLLVEQEKFPSFTIYPSIDVLDSIVELDSALFLFVGDHLALTKDEVNTLFQGIKKGNDCFLSTQHLPDYFFEELADSVMVTYYLADQVTVKNQGKSFDLINLFYGDTLPGAWNVLPTYRITNKKTNWKVLSTLQEGVVYYEIQLGKGRIYLYLAPQAFYNYQLKRKEGFKHFLQVFAPIKGAHVHWMQFAMYENNQVEEAEKEGSPEDSLLSKIIEQPALKWAFIVLIIGMILYFILNSRRIQPIVPIIQKNMNQGYNYVTTIGGIYYSNDKPSQLLHVLRKNFYTFIQKTFYIDLNKDNRERQVILLAEKAGLPKERIEHVLKIVDKKYCSSNEELLQTYTVVYKFYEDAGVWEEKVTLLQQQKETIIYRSNIQSWGVIGIGAFLLLMSFVLLAFAVSWGILLWPLGIAIIILGSRLLARPLLSFNKEQFIFYPLFTRAVDYSFSDLTKVEREGEVLTFVFSGSRKIIINLKSVNQQQHGLVLELKYQFNKKNNGNTNE